MRTRRGYLNEKTDFFKKHLVILWYLQGRAGARGQNKYLDFIITGSYSFLCWLNQRGMEAAAIVGIGWPQEHIVSCRRQRNELERQSKGRT